MDDERFPVCVIDKRCVLLFGHDGGCVGRIGKTEEKSIIEVVAEIADFANSIAELVVGHRRILVSGGFDPVMSDIMCQALHAKLLGLVHTFEPDFDDPDNWPDIEEDDDAD